jgi:aspartyl-tRNA synthetase
MLWRIYPRRPPIIASSYTQIQPLISIYERQIVPGNLILARPFSVKSYGLLAAAGGNSRHYFLSDYKKSCEYPDGGFPIVNHALTLTRRSTVLTSPFPETVHLGSHDSNREYIGKRITVHGFLGKRKDLSEKLSFVQLALAEEHGSGIQVVSRVEDSPASGSAATSEDVHKNLKNTRRHSAVSISGVLERKRKPSGKNVVIEVDKLHSMENLELVLQDITCLAAFPEDIIIGDDVQFGPENRHLQLRFDLDLRMRLRFRDSVVRECRTALQDFQEIETPILFKSTPEGAREFLVPTRRPGYAYALPQSPQQYKQILMASGIYKYFQIAKCFRDEDLRADRQPEFTQVCSTWFSKFISMLKSVKVDLEMAFSDGEKVMTRTERFIYSLIDGLIKNHPHQELVIRLPKLPLPRMTYHEAMYKHGSDKPDLRIPDEVGYLQAYR